MKMKIKSNQILNHFKQEKMKKIKLLMNQIMQFSNRCFLKFRKIHVKTTLLDSLFKNVADLKDRNFIKKRLRDRYFPVNFLQFFKKQNTSRWPLYWFFHSNRSFIHWSQFFCFFLHFFLLLLIIAIMGIYSESV